MLKQARLWKRNNTYYIRVAVPDKLSRILDKKEIKYSLKTDKYRDALVKLREESLKIDRLFLSVSEENNMRYEKNTIYLNPDEVTKVLLGRYDYDYNKERYPGIKVHTTVPFIAPPFLEYDYDKYMEYVKGYVLYELEKRQALLDKETLAVYEELKNNKVETVKEDLKEGWSKLSRKRELLENDPTIKKMKGYKSSLYDISFIRDLAKLDEHFDTTVKNQIDPIAVKIFHLAKKDYFNADEKEEANRLKKVNFSVNKTTDWKKIFEYMWEEKILQNPIGKEKYQKNTYYNALSLFFEIAKTNDVTEITEAFCTNYSSKTIYLVPKNLMKLEEYKGKNIADCLLKPNQRDKGLSAKTIEKYITPLKQFFRYAKKYKYVDEDLSIYFSLPKKGSRTQGLAPRDIFIPTDLVKIFSNLPNPTQKPDMFYIPLLALYSGARLNEICQLSVDDIREENGVWIFSINKADKNNSVKNSQSIRKVPIHQKLIDLGFLDYVKKRKKEKKNGKLFNLTYTEKNSWGGGFSKRFRTYLDKFGIERQGENGKKCFHSFRHTFTEHLMEQGVSTELRNCICGWTQKGIGEAIYANHRPISVINEAVQKADYKEINPILDDLKKKYRL